MPAPTVTWLRPRGQPGYTDTAALNDIHALLTTGTGDGDRDLLGDIAVVMTRTGRPMVRGRDIDTSLSESPTGWPVAQVEAEDTTVTVRQHPAGTGLLIEITTRTQAERDQLAVTLDGRCLHHPCPPGGRAA
jgi:hypothetical protein